MEYDFVLHGGKKFLRAMKGELEFETQARVWKDQMNCDYRLYFKKLFQGATGQIK